MVLPIRFHFLGGQPMESMALFAAICHDLMIVSIGLQLVLIALLLLYYAWSAFRLWRKGVEFSATLVPTLEQKVALPPPGPVLMWAVQWDLDIRAMVDDLKNEGPSVVERYCQNEAFMNKLRKIVRNVVSQSEMIRITQEVRMKRELEKFQRMNFQKSAEEEDEDAKAWQAMMLEMTGEKPQETQIDVNVGAPAQQMSTVFEGDDAEALEAMMAVMNRKPFEAAVAEPPIPTPAPQAAFNADDAAALEAMMSVMNRKPFEDVPAEVPEPISTPAASFEGDDAAAWDAMLSVMNRKPFEDAPPEVPAPISTPAASFEGDDAAAWDAMMSAMNRKPFEENAEPASSALHEDDAAALEAMMSVVSRKPFEDATEAPAPISAESTSLQQDDAAAWDAMLSVMNRKPFEAEAAPVQASPALQGDDAAALDLMMSVVNQKPCEDSPKGLLQSDCSTEHVQVLEKSESEQSDDTSELWAQLEDMEKNGASLQAQVQKLVSVCAPSTWLPIPEDQESLATTHFFIGDSDEEEQLDDFWNALDEDLCRGAEILPHAQKLVDCFRPKVPTCIGASQQFYIGDEVEGTAQQFYIGDEDVPEMSLP
ncbi:unnamed protein product [Durusdinium trenchii]|uniref:Uncharacterized protein n=1 Tax=Durusdinium trenchii TaxID=1381693 RepID=A0ABP0QJ87_9DINO